MNVDSLTVPVITREERELLQCFRKLDTAAKRSAADYLAWLGERDAKDSDAVLAQQQPLAEPNFSPRPKGESVVKAIKRLKTTYFMIEATNLFQQTSELMTQHIMQGRPSSEVIDDLEDLFRETYEQQRSEPS